MQTGETVPAGSQLVQLLAAATLPVWAGDEPPRRSIHWTPAQEMHPCDRHAQRAWNEQIPLVALLMQMLQVQPQV